MFLGSQNDQSAGRIRSLLDRSALTTTAQQPPAADNVSTSDGRPAGNTPTEAQTRVGPEFQAVIPEFRGMEVIQANELKKEPQTSQAAARPDSERLPRNVALWLPSAKISDADLNTYIEEARKNDLNEEQALGLLLFHRRSIENARADISNFVGTPCDWFLEEKAIFEQGLVLYGKRFSQTRRNLLPHRTTQSIVEYFYTVYKPIKHREHPKPIKHHLNSVSANKHGAKRANGKRRRRLIVLETNAESSDDSQLTGIPFDDASNSQSSVPFSTQLSPSTFSLQVPVLSRANSNSHSQTDVVDSVSKTLGDRAVRKPVAARSGANSYGYLHGYGMLCSKYCSATAAKTKRETDGESQTEASTNSHSQCDTAADCDSQPAIRFDSHDLKFLRSVLRRSSASDADAQRSNKKNRSRFPAPNDRQSATTRLASRAAASGKFSTRSNSKLEPPAPPIAPSSVAKRRKLDRVAAVVPTKVDPAVQTEESSDASVTKATEKAAPPIQCIEMDYIRKVNDAFERELHTAASWLRRFDETHGGVGNKTGVQSFELTSRTRIEPIRTRAIAKSDALKSQESGLSASPRRSDQSGSPSSKVGAVRPTSPCVNAGACVARWSAEVCRVKRTVKVQVQRSCETVVRWTPLEQAIVRVLLRRKPVPTGRRFQEALGGTKTETEIERFVAQLLATEQRI